MKLYNTLTRKKQIFKPIKAKEVGLYSCGPTVYNYAHIGNLRSYIFSDVLRRVLEYNNFKVKQIINITDVGHLTDDADEGEDKMEKAAKLQKKSAWGIAKFYEEEFKKTLKDLNIETPYKMPRATEHIKEQIKLVQILEKKGFVYRTSDGIYFDTSRIKDYGKLSGQKLAEKKGGARVKLSAEKRNKVDFALWKFSQAGEKRQMEWDSPWGVGFPGWHIECSAMSVKYLGQPFDIHTGGIDHIAVHHSNEIAQSEAITDKKLANYWLHNEFVKIAKGKMAKSKGNFITLNELVKKGFSPLSYRYLILQTNYRKPINFSIKALTSAQNALEKIYEEAEKLEAPKIGCAEFEKKFKKAIDDDLNTSEALAVLWKTLKSDYPKSAKSASILKFDKILGLSIARYIGKKIEIPKEIKKMAEEREEARKDKNWKLSDNLRNKIEKKGYYIEDADSGFKISKK